MHLATEGNSFKTCYKCGTTTYRDKCPTCEAALSGDSVIDATQAKIEAGEDIDLEQMLREGSWEPVEQTKGGA